MIKKTLTNSFAILWVFLPLFFGYLSPVLDGISLCPHIKAPTLNLCIGETYGFKTVLVFLLIRFFPTSGAQYEHKLNGGERAKALEPKFKVSA